MPPNNNTQNIERAIDALTRAILSNTPSFNNNKYKFRVTKTSAQNTAAGSFTKILCNSITFDTSAGIDATTNYRFTAPVAGYYWMAARANIGASNTTILIPSLYKNGTEYSRGEDHRLAAASRGGMVHDVIYLAAGDYVEFFLYCDVAVALDVTATWLTYFTGFLISQG